MRGRNARTSGRTAGMTTPPTPDPRTRFFLLHLARLAGVALVVSGLLVLEGQIALPRAAGWALLVAGIVDVFVVPQLLARKWQSRKP